MNKILLAVTLSIGFSSLSSLASQAPSDGSNLQTQLQQLQQALAQSQISSSSQAKPAEASSAAIGAATPMTVQNQSTQNLATGSVPQTAPSVSGNATNTSAPTSADSLRDEAFGRMTTTTLPLTPAQIEMLRKLYDETQKAASLPSGIPAKPILTSISVDLSPGATPPTVRLSAGFVTSLVFVDSTGAPWPISSYSIGNPSAFNVQWDNKSNILLIQAITSYRAGNLAVILKGLNTPVMVDLKPGQAALDMRVDLHIPALGPDSTPSLRGLPGVESPVLISLLDGIPPSGSKTLKSSGCDNCAWLYNGKLYLRTRFNVISPAWTSTLASADGTRVYEMSPTPVILASYNGKTIKMIIEGF